MSGTFFKFTVVKPIGLAIWANDAADDFGYFDIAEAVIANQGDELTMIEFDEEGDVTVLNETTKAELTIPYQVLNKHCEIELASNKE